MGTNYYAELNLCINCERRDRIHIGKSSAGWKFLIAVNELYYKTFNEFMEFIRREDIEICDEYNKKISFDELMDLIEAKEKGRSHTEEYPEDKYADCKEADLHKGGFS